MLNNPADMKTSFVHFIFPFNLILVPNLLSTNLVAIFQPEFAFPSSSLIISISKRCESPLCTISECLPYETNFSSGQCVEKTYILSNKLCQLHAYQ